MDHSPGDGGQWTIEPLREEFPFDTLKNILELAPGVRVICELNTYFVSGVPLS